MKKLLVILGIIVLVIIIAAGAVFYGIKSYLTPEKVSAMISEKLESAIHHKVKLGPISTGFSSASIDGFTLLPNTPGETVPLVKIKRVSISFSLIPLLKKRLEIGKILIESPEITVVREKDGSLNWRREFKQVSFDVERRNVPTGRAGFSLVAVAVAAEAKPESKGFAVKVDEIALKNGTLKWVDKRLIPAYKAEITALQLDITDFSLDSPFDFDLKGILKREKTSEIKAKGTFDMARKDLKGEVTLRAFYLPDIAPYLENEDVKLLRGTGDMTLKFSTRHFELWKLDQALELTSVQLEARGRKSLEIMAKLQLAASLDLEKGYVTVKNLQGKIADSDFTVTGELNDIKAVPKGKFTFLSNKMDVDTLMGLAGIFPGAPEEGKKEKTPSAGKAGKTPPGTKKKPKKPAKAKTLPSLTVNATIHLLTVRKVKIEEVKTKVVTRGHTLIMNPLTAKVYGGTVQGKMTVDLRGGIPVVKKEISLKNVDIAPLLSDMKPGMKEKFSGHFFGDARGQGVVGAPSTYQGDMSFHVEKGSIRNVAFMKIAAAIMNLPSLAHLRFDVLDGKAEVKDKKVEILSTKAKGKDISFTAQGDIGFDKTMRLQAMLTLPYKVVRKGLGKRSDLFKDVKDPEGRKWSLIPIRVRGTLGKPRVSVKFQAEAVEKIIDKNVHDKKLRKILKKLFK